MNDCISFKRKFLWLGSYQSAEQFKTMLARNIGQASGYASQKGLMKGLDAIKQPDTEIDTISVIAYPLYPQYPQKHVDEIRWSRTGASTDVCIGFRNTHMSAYLSRWRSLLRAAKDWGRSHRGDENTVIIYEPSVEKLQAALMLKKRYAAKVFVVIPDVPELVNLGASRVKRLVKKLFANIMRKQFKNVDGFILYSACMADYYGFSPGRWMLMEGVFDPEEADINTVADSHDTTRLIYCGALDEYRGIPQLLDAFQSLEDNSFELWLTGAGRSVAEIKHLARKDKRIQYFGYLENRNDVLKLQLRSDILVHIRSVTSPAAPYCFPSKLLEYLVTGKPVISVILPGIPEEYYQYMVPIQDLTSDGIRGAIMKAVEQLKQGNSTGQKARDFVLNNKSSHVQAQRIMDFINSKV